MNGTSDAVVEGVAWQALLREGALFGGAAGLLVTVVSAFWGVPATVGAAVGAVLGVGAFAAGPLLLRTVAQWSPPAVMAAALGGYLVVVFVLGLAYALLEPVEALSHLHLGVCLVVVCVAETVGQMRAVGRLRVLAFGAPGDPLQSAKRPGQHEEPGAPYTPRD